jgi:uncharacterized protein
MSAPACNDKPLHGIFHGRVWHTRREPFHHAFDYAVAFLALDLDALDTAFRSHPFWALNRRALGSFHEADHLGGGADLAARARVAVEKRLGFRPAGAVQLVCQPRYAGYAFNPVTFYFFHRPDSPDANRPSLDAIVLEVANTPWNERHVYALDCRDRTGPWRFEVDKRFHVSPFLPMDMRYVFDFDLRGDRMEVTKRNLEADKVIFVARMVLQLESLDRRGLGRLLAAFPPRTIRVIAAIYWQALRLWVRGARYHPHPINVADSSASR